MRFFVCLLFLFIYAGGQAQTDRTPAYPLITHDPYFSVWSFSDKLYETPTKHWTGSDQPLLGVISVDEKPYRFLGHAPDVYKTIVPAADEEQYASVFTETKPVAGWEAVSYDDKNWKSGKGSFGDDDKKNGNSWRSHELWMRRGFDVKNTAFNELFLKLIHDDDVEVYLNGKQVLNKKGATSNYIYLPMPKKLLHQGKNWLAIHIVNTGGAAMLDAGIVDMPPPKKGEAVDAKQVSVNVTATKTAYVFSAGGVQLNLDFVSPLLMDDLNQLSRPVTYIVSGLKSEDGKKHRVKFSLLVSASLAANTPNQQLETSRYEEGDFLMTKSGTKEQPVLAKRGDDLRIDWGYLYVAAPKNEGFTQLSTTSPEKEAMLGNSLQIEELGAEPKQQTILVAYDDLYSIQYFNQNLRPWWKNDASQTIEKQIAQAYQDRGKILEACEAFDKKLHDDAYAAGGEEYAQLCEMAYRQSIAAHKLVKGPQDELLFLSKENFSNGCINTVDVTYPSAPLFLLYNPDLLKGMLNGIFYYSESNKWTKPFAAHDLGTYPQANGQVYGEDMPVEESGNLLILTAAIAKTEGNAEYARKHWKTLTTWAEYLLKEGFDPANQLCTDDFAGHLARNANLSIKAIMGIAGYSMLAQQLGYADVSKRFHDTAVFAALPTPSVPCDA